MKIDIWVIREKFWDDSIFQVNFSTKESQHSIKRVENPNIGNYVWEVLVKSTPILRMDEAMLNKRYFFSLNCMCREIAHWMTTYQQKKIVSFEEFTS